MKRLQLYYWYIGLPVVLVALGVVIFLDAIAGTVRGNPHPQINYIIFVLIALGCYQMLAHVWRINREGNLFRQYRKMIESGIQDHEIEALLSDLSKKHDVVPLIQLIQGLRGKPISPVQHAAAESEMERFAARQSRRLMMAQFMGGLMVGMGLLGTFIGLLGALAEIGKLIGSFNLGAGMTDPLATISELVARLTAPMQAMGVAFSASLFGVLGSLIMGVLMVGVKGASTDLVSFVQSDTALLLEITPQEESTQDHDSLAKALAQLAENSPILRGLAVALDHSERRVRELLGGMATLVSRVETSNHASSSMVEQMHRQSQQHDQLIRSISQIQNAQASANEQLHQLVNVIDRAVDQSRQQAEMVQTVWSEQSQRLNGQLIEQQQLWQQHTQHQQQLVERQHEHWRTQSQLEQKTRQEEWAHWAQIQNGGLQQMVQHLQASQRQMDQLLLTLRQEAQARTQLHEQGLQHRKDIMEVIETSASQVCREAESRTESLARVDAMLRENQFRNEQIVQLLSQAVQQVQTPAA